MQYVWEDFTVEYARLARAIKMATFEGFLTISDEEQKITDTVRRMFAAEGFDVKSYVTETQQQRLHLRRAAEAQASARIDAAMKSALRNANQVAEERDAEAPISDEYENEWEADIRE